MPRSGRVGWRGPKTYVGEHLPPIQRIFDLTDAYFSRRRTGHDSGVEYTRIGPTGPIYVDGATKCAYIGFFLIFVQ